MGFACPFVKILYSVLALTIFASLVFSSPALVSGDADAAEIGPLREARQYGGYGGGGGGGGGGYGGGGYGGGGGGYGGGYGGRHHHHHHHPYRNYGKK